MTRGPALAVMSVAVVVLVTGCGGSDEPSEVVETGVTETTPMETDATETTPVVACRAAPPPAVTNIEFGLTRGGSLGGAKFVEVPAHERNSQGWPQWFIAARVKGSVGVWATSRGGDGPIAAIDDVSRTHTDWGTAAQPGSQAWEIQESLRATEAADAAASCVR